jgi:hypothetical protein
MWGRRRFWSRRRRERRRPRHADRRVTDRHLVSSGHPAEGASHTSAGSAYRSSASSDRSDRPSALLPPLLHDERRSSFEYPWGFQPIIPLAGRRVSRSSDGAGRASLRSRFEADERGLATELAADPLGGWCETVAGRDIRLATVAVWAVCFVGVCGGGRAGTVAGAVLRVVVWGVVGRTVSPIALVGFRRG